mmetsp:Transcript_22723/g.51898  ORF Transcript_22723/g.51898 Transcript_22723/m.51898 type:complete len:323 (-) Transcript_22723:42-1010(-)
MAGDDVGGSSLQLQLAVAGIVVLVTALIGMFMVLMRTTSEEEGKEKKDKPSKKEASGQARKRGALDRMQRGAAAGSAQAAAPTTADEEDDDEEDEDDDDGTGRGGKRNAKKQEKKAEKKAQQQAQRQMRQEQENSKADKQGKYKQKQAEKDAERARQEEEERREAEEKARREKEDFDKWKVSFAVEAEGDETAADLGDSSVERFIEHIEMRKVVHLEDVASSFQMRTAAVINRIKELEKLGRLSGIFDDRGKYVYVSSEEMQNVAEWLQKKGRISRTDLVAACNRMIRLEPTAENEAKLREEALSAVEGAGEDEVAEAATTA